MNSIRILLLGDIVGSAGRAIFQKYIQTLKKQYSIDGIIVNGENSANGRGITSRIVRFFKHNGVDMITTGNHIWHHKEINEYLQNNKDLLRPANYPSECPGIGVSTFMANNTLVGVINIQGRVFMKDHLACPFKTAESALSYLKSKTPIIFIDFHAEATSEKTALAYYLDGKISGLVGTHTHVQTADERILPKGTAYISDLGMAGALHSLIGMKKEPIIHNFLTQMPVKFTVETEGPMILGGVCIEVDKTTGKALSIERIKIIDENIILDGLSEDDL